MTKSRRNDDVRDYHEWDEDRSVASSVVRAVAAALDRAPSQVDPVSEVVDTDALEALFSPEAEDPRRDVGSVSFTFEGCDVTVYACGEIVVSPPD